MSLLNKSISELLKLMELNEVSSEEITKTSIENIEKNDLGSALYQISLKDEAIKKSKEIDVKRKNKEDLGSLAGIPVAISDDISTKGILTTAGSKILENYIPPFNATVVERLLDEGSIILGKAKVNEFGLTPSSKVSEVLDANGAAFGIGTSMDSSKVSMKPTFGLISRYGVIGASSSFDQIVPVTNSVEDLAVVLNTIAGYDKRDSQSINTEKKDYTKSLTAEIKGLKVAIPTGIKSDKIDRLSKELEKLGATIQEVNLSTLEYILPVYKILSSAEFASNSARYDGISLGYRTESYEDMDELYKKTRSEGFNKEAKKTILFGNYVISSGQYEKLYVKAQKIRAMIKEEFTRVTREYGLILMPYGENESLNIVSNVTGLPAITIPNGIQLIGPYLGEEELIKVAYIVEKQGGAK
ncbi:MAG: amidase family protein [Tissierellaceae bacterium]|nr:amidase family protein [Tissierellaceae bacterium]